MTPDWLGAFADLPREHGFEPLRVDGKIPDELAGTLYRCGPAALTRYAHPFDGDGAITAVRFARGAAWGGTRLVETPGFVAERAAGCQLFPAYATLPPQHGRALPRPKNAANTSVMTWRDRVFALHEASAPTEFDAETLATRGESDLGAREVGDGFSAHPRRAGTRYFNFGMRYGAQTQLELFELGDAMRVGPRIPLAGATMIHDFAATPRHLVFFAPPLRLRAAELVAGRISYGDALEWRPEHGTEVIVVPIADPGAAIRFETEPMFHWHVANAFERGDEIVVDFVHYRDFGTNRWLASLLTGDPWRGVRHGQLARATIAPAARELRLEARGDCSVEFPRVAPAVESLQHRFVYAVAHSPAAAEACHPHDRLVRIDVERGDIAELPLAAGQYPSEPIFLPRGLDETAGWVASLVYDATASASCVALYDAAHPGDGAIARAWFDHHIPTTFHGIWRQP